MKGVEFVEVVGGDGRLDGYRRTLVGLKASACRIDRSPSPVTDEP
ncbi:hypothetical protein MBEHAL_2692 [Halarchaeum acidiphilum MH1-52-1]|uniref:Uncharacterized protein n=1 Tax=Halarchaeum acidiphilum MH1-52-1 TaxID=1261545 RepID=U2YYQ3_9EURY|nr:hypothetical protein MBEHAL_2692 [Halarchaeum acidiphilum MH1-52-1]